MKGKYFNLDYVPNKVAYVYQVTSEKIKFLAFFSEKGKGLKAIKHSVSKKSKKDFTKLKTCFLPTNELNILINETLKL